MYIVFPGSFFILISLLLRTLRGLLSLAHAHTAPVATRPNALRRSARLAPAPFVSAERRVLRVFLAKVV